ncbi:threonine synthase [Sphingomonas quercus]|uniref:Pyridoxal-phosphate dependent enzyme n=1 Tax=Sphingomonas quercus TaxID=2842451 RepID=A0ABS6BHG9_9SPHN|nr:pyridoxal-phosphate dependent enzyme [Sphingomonas quercus]MBU3077746.1 pyridoxal-phosphate dependent enzyme [Sphingomonas quercus]
MPPRLVEPATGAAYPIDLPRWRGDAGGPLMITPLPGIGRDDIDAAAPGLWRYRAALPLAVAVPITLGEGRTPLVAHRRGGRDVLLKLDWFGPTGSFKDKGAAIMLSVLREQGVAALVADSSGNAGAAIAAYGAAGGLDVRILAPEAASPAKLAQIRLYGADVRTVAGPRQHCEAEAIRQSTDRFYASHNWQPFFLQGTKLTAYELWEDLGFRAPDAVIIPCGAGSNVLGCDIGFGELRAAGQIDRLPRLYAAQPANCAPLAAAIAGTPAPPFATTIAEGASIRQPVRPTEIVAAVRRSGGAGVMIADAAIGAAMLDLARTGLFVEPTAALAVAALDELLATGAIAPGETVVALLTGTGLKAMPTAMALLE